jgi:homoserine dehydrogenase
MRAPAPSAVSLEGKWFASLSVWLSTVHRRLRRADRRRRRPPKRAVEAALKAGKPVVTANKALLARHGTEARLAEKNGVA